MHKLLRFLSILCFMVVTVVAYPIRSYGTSIAISDISLNACRISCAAQDMKYRYIPRNEDDTVGDCTCIPGSDEEEACECSTSADCGGSGYYCDGCMCGTRVYSISYNMNGGSVVENQQYEVEDGTITLPTPTREGYVFDGWYESECLSCDEAGEEGGADDSGDYDYGNCSDQCEDEDGSEECDRCLCLRQGNVGLCRRLCYDVEDCDPVCIKLCDITGEDGCGCTGDDDDGECDDCGDDDDEEYTACQDGDLDQEYCCNNVDEMFCEGDDDDDGECTEEDRLQELC